MKTHLTCILAILAMTTASLSTGFAFAEGTTADAPLVTPPDMPPVEPEAQTAPAAAQPERKMGKRAEKRMDRKAKAKAHAKSKAKKMKSGGAKKDKLKAKAKKVQAKRKKKT